MLLEIGGLDLDLATEDNEYSPLCAACMAGNLEVVEMLAENGANVNYKNSLNQTPLVHCFSRLTEAENIFENKTICLRIGSELLKSGAILNSYVMGRTLLQNFCGIRMTKLEAPLLEMNLEVVTYLLQNGANPDLKCEVTGKNAFELAETHCSKERLLLILNNTKQIYFHPNAEADCVLDDSSIA